MKKLLRVEDKVISVNEISRSQTLTTASPSAMTNVYETVKKLITGWGPIQGDDTDNWGMLKLDNTLRLNISIGVVRGMAVMGVVKEICPDRESKVSDFIYDTCMESVKYKVIHTAMCFYNKDMKGRVSMVVDAMRVTGISTSTTTAVHWADNLTMKGLEEISCAIIVWGSTR